MQNVCVIDQKIFQARTIYLALFPQSELWFPIYTETPLILINGTFSQQTEDAYQKTPNKVENKFVLK